VAVFEKLPRSFFGGEDVTSIARDLIGMWLVTRFSGETTVGMIVETEAYAGILDKASHAWNDRRTARTEVMYGPPGHAYVYLCYGMHHLFNVVTNAKNSPHAVLIRALSPVKGVTVMAKRTGKDTADTSITRGPGNLSRAMGIDVRLTGADLQGSQIFIARGNESIDPAAIIASPRIGVAYAGKDALLPYRFYLRNNPYVSGKNYTSRDEIS
jgi:DNA-3-methyladenine glycosylase